MSYRTRLVLGIMLVIAPILVLMTMNRMSIIRELTYERELNHLNSIGSLLADEVEENLTRGARARVDEILALSALQPDIVCVNVVDPAGVVVHSSDSTRLGREPLQQETDDPAAQHRETYVKSFPVNTQRGRHSLQIGYSLAQTHADFAVALRWAIAFDLALFVSASLMAWFISGFMEKPVRVATEAAQRVAAGDFGIALTRRTDDAYGQLIEALNRMATDLATLTHDMQAKIDAATAELTEKNQRLMELDTLKSEFVAMVSHELRTPLTSIIGFAKTLRRIPMPPGGANEYLMIIEKEGRHLASLIEEYLDISKIETGSFSLSPVEARVEEIAREVVAWFPRATNITLDITGDLPVLMVDDQRLRRVIRNLLDNAVKHGGPDVAIDLKVAGDRAGVTVSVSDNGPGIPLRMRDKIFEKFYRGAADKGGSGLGLAIVKAIVEAHGGRIWCESEPGKGATFTFTLPRDAPQART